MADVKARFLLPLRDNDGRDLSVEIAHVEVQMYEAFGAWTQEGYYKGAWRMQTGERQVDTSPVYFLIVPERRLPDLESILRSFKAKTKQEGVYLEMSGT